MQLGSCPQNRIWPIFNLYLLHVSYIYHHILKKPTPIIVTTIPKLYQLCLPLRLRDLRKAVTSQCHLCALLATGLLSGRCCWHSRRHRGLGERYSCIVRCETGNTNVVVTFFGRHISQLHSDGRMWTRRDGVEDHGLQACPHLCVLTAGSQSLSQNR
jgi:hypothetical protein